MKNLISLVTGHEIVNFMGSLWRSEAFRASHEGGGYVYWQVARFAWLPRLFAEVSNEHLERAHFSTWWNVIMLREYDNPILHDLYYLHEMTHAATMPYIPGIGREAFNEKMQRNELEASVLSEIAVYFEMPELRATSFHHPIYADRFINDSHMITLWQANRDVAVETLRAIRRNVMVSKSEHLMDKSETWIRRFADQNSVYANVWADRYSEIEQRMSQLQNDVGEKGARRALLDYRNWLEAEAARDPIDNIPFRQEAELFSPFYWANKAKYEEAMKNDA